MGRIAFAPPAQGLLTGKYPERVPEESRAARGTSLDPGLLSADAVRRLRGLNAVAADRGQPLARPAPTWVPRDPRTAPALIGASSVRPLEESVAALSAPAPTAREITAIDEFTVTERGVTIWAARS